MVSRTSFNCPMLREYESRTVPTRAAERKSMGTIVRMPLKASPDARKRTSSSVSFRQICRA